MTMCPWPVGSGGMCDPGLHSDELLPCARAVAGASVHFRKADRCLITPRRYWGARPSSPAGDCSPVARPPAARYLDRRQSLLRDPCRRDASGRGTSRTRRRTAVPVCFNQRMGVRGPGRAQGAPVQRRRTDHRAPCGLCLFDTGGYHSSLRTYEGTIPDRLRGSQVTFLRVPDQRSAAKPRGVAAQ